MTVHAAKGLEFPVVCVADLGRQPNFSTPELLVDGERIGLRLLGLDGEEPVQALDYEELSRERREREGQEEDRILYVAMTRARERLLLSGSIDVGALAAAERQRARRSRGWRRRCAPGSPRSHPPRRQPVHELEVGEGEATVRCVLSTPAHAEELLGLAPAPRRDPAVPAARPGSPHRPGPPPGGGAARAARGARRGAARARAAGGAARRGSGDASATPR